MALCTAAAFIVAVPAWAAPGALDLTFSGDGKVATVPPDFNSDSGEDVVVQADGKILVVGSRVAPDEEDVDWPYTLVARYLEDGTPDPGFGGGDGLVTLAQGSAGSAVELLSDQRIAIGGYVRDGFDYAFAAFVLTTAGELDSSFDGDGVAIADFGTGRDVAYGLDVDASDGIVLAGWSESTEKIGLVRFSSTGAPDTTFSDDGKRLVLTNAIAHDVDVRPNGKIVVVGEGGQPRHIVVARFLADGTLDTTFSTNGIATTGSGAWGSAVSVQADGKIVVAGHRYGTHAADFVIARFLPGGQLDTTFNEVGVVKVDFDDRDDQSKDVEIQPNGKIVAVGYATMNGTRRFGIVRLRPDGRRDLTFSGDGKAAQVRGFGLGSALDGTSRLVVTGASSGDALTARYRLL